MNIEQPLIELMDIEGRFGTIENKDKFSVIKNTLYAQQKEIENLKELMTQNHLLKQSESNE